MRLAIVAALALSQSACVLTQPSECFNHYDHISHPLQGPPFGPVADEGTLDSIGTSCRWEEGQLFFESGVSYLWWPDAGLWGDNFIYSGRIGYTFYSKGER